MNTDVAPEGTHILTFSFEKYQELWRKLSSIDGLFDDFHKGREDLFLSLIADKSTLWLERDDGNGILYLTSIIPGLSATAHIVYWDRRLRTREEFTMNCLRWAMEKLNLQKINLYLPAYAAAARHFAKKLGFKEEGCIRKWSLKNGKPFDIYVYGITHEEAFNG